MIVFCNLDQVTKGRVGALLLRVANMNHMVLVVSLTERKRKGGVVLVLFRGCRVRQRQNRLHAEV